MIVQFPTIAALCDAFEALPSHIRDRYGDQTQNLRLGRYGDPRLVPEAEKLLSQITAQVETPVARWDRAPGGAYACVPEYLAGLPTPMRARRFVPHDQGPVTILVGTASSVGVSADQFLRRGVAILALVMALSRTRPITLAIVDPGYGTDASGETTIVARINTAPLDLASACYVLTSLTFTRQIAYAVEEKLSGTVLWPRGYNAETYYAGLVRRMNLDPDSTLTITDAHLTQIIHKEPLKWVNEQVRKFTTAAEDGGNEAEYGAYGA